MEKRYDVLCLGMMVYDILVRAVDQNVFNRDMTAVESIQFRTGGDAMTQSIISARLGSKTGLISKVGDDAQGEYLLKELENNQVDTDYVSICSAVDTAITVALIQEDGNRNFITSPGKNNATLCLKDFPMEVIFTTKVLGYGSMFHMRELDPVVGEAVFGPAKEHGVLTVMDCCYPSYDLPLATVINTLPYISYFVPSIEEAMRISGMKSPDEIARKFASYGCENVVIKLGGSGCYVHNSRYSQYIPAINNIPVVDTTGAGDNFVGGFMHSIAAGKPFLEAVAFAQATAAVSIQHIGATTGVRSQKQVLEFLKKNSAGV